MFRCKLLLSISIVVLVLAFVGAAQGVNILSNPGFESYGDDGWGNLVPTGWGVWTDDWANVVHRAIDTTVEGGTAHGGNVYWKLDDHGWSVLVGLQNVGESVAGTTQTLGVWLRSGVEGVAQSAEIGFDFAPPPDGAGWWGDDHLAVLVPGDGGWHYYEHTAALWSGSYVKAKVAALDSIIHVDDASLTPEPATLALLGLGGLALIRRKR